MANTHPRCYPPGVNTGVPAAYDRTAAQIIIVSMSTNLPLFSKKNQFKPKPPLRIRIVAMNHQISNPL
jgi:hypothetical protein